MSKWAITGATQILDNGTVKNGTLVIDGEHIDMVTKKNVTVPVTLKADDAVMAPGLINGHDHLLGNYYPKVGNGPYENWLPWDNDLKSSPLYQERMNIDNRDLYLLGSYRNLVSGVTTVSDHMPHFVAEPYYDILPVKAIRRYALVHSIASFALNWGESIEAEYQRAVDEDIPFVTHISEGFDNETVKDIVTLKRRGALGDHAVLVHGLAFSESDIKLIKESGASVVWCGDSNMFMYNATTNVKKMLGMGVNVCIGTDSPMSGGLNLLHEMKFDKATYKDLFSEELPDAEIVKMVTSNTAKAFWLKKNGHLKEGFLADLTLVRNQGGPPVSSVVKAELRDVMLVVINGRPVYGNAEYSVIFDALNVKYQRIVLDGMEKVIIGDPIGLLKRISRAVGFKKEFPFLPISFDV